MSYLNEIYTIVRDAMRADALANNASQASLDSIDEMAMDVAESVANTVIDDVVSKLNDLGSALNVFMSAVSSTPTTPNDGGATYKAGLVATVSNVQSAISSLTSSINSFRG